MAAPKNKEVRRVGAPALESAPASSPSVGGTNDSLRKIYSQDIHRAMPHSVEAEKALLSSVLLNPTEVLDESLSRLGRGTDAFFVPAHQTIFSTMVELYDARHQPVDFVTLSEALKEKGLLDQVGGTSALAELIDYVPSAANAAYYSEILLDKMMARRLINTCNEFSRRAYDLGEGTKALLDEAETKLMGIRDENAFEQVRPISDHVIEAVDALDKLANAGDNITGLATGFPDLDRMTDGLHRGEMAVIAARPSMGKTALAMNIAEHVAVDQQRAVAVFSLEMSARQLVQRLICSRARINVRKVRGRMLSHNDFNLVTTAASQLQAAPMFIDETPGMSILELRSKARRLKKRYQIELVVIDYLQLLKSDSRRAQDSRQVEVAEISGGIKSLAKEIDVPVLVLAQLNRQPDGRGGRPRLSDLRDSGAIEQDADLVGLLYRPEYYADGDDDKLEDSEGKAELIIAKQRNGPVGEVPLTFIKDFTRFESRARNEAEEE